MATALEWQSLIRAIRYDNAADPATSGARTFSFKLTDSHERESNTAVSTVTVV